MQQLCIPELKFKFIKKKRKTSAVEKFFFLTYTDINIKNNVLIYKKNVLILIKNNINRMLFCKTKTQQFSVQTYIWKKKNI